MSLVDKTQLLADGLNKWLWNYRGNALYTKVIKGKIWIFVSNCAGTERIKICEAEVLKTGIYVPSTKEFDKIIREKEKKAGKIDAKAI